MESAVKWSGSAESSTKQASRHAHALAPAHNQDGDKCGGSGSDIPAISLMPLFEARDRQKNHIVLALSKLHSVSSFVD
ncbi:hypothetical protein WUBG_16333 [Wuchereria bancrofti]|uniref:Uncharacterized protein n=1 Tax=Wuchereria bancrofti TaxID=6293 RepID=J9AFD3_WUCBA|nr:hypothetical protein WUBG_16333 [Wuchereria bancrofti]VDM07356.1 unnamed protein product [Wuchereria bancrofti]